MLTKVETSKRFTEENSLKLENKVKLPNKFPRKIGVNPTKNKVG